MLFHASAGRSRIVSRHSSYRISPIIAFCVICGYASLPTNLVAANPPERPTALVLVADGAGNFCCASTSLAQVVGETHAPLRVQPFIWSHGYLRILADQTGPQHNRTQGKRLAELVLLCKEQCPERPIYLVGHSAGAAVILNAADTLPPDSIERIILLAPSVSHTRDLHGPLSAARLSVDVFYSKADRWYLGMAVTLLGTTDRHWNAAAGRVGFQPTIRCPADGPLYEKLRQYPWDEQLSYTGHYGGHYGGYQPGFLKLCVLPLMGVE
jgi:pimeloyl-ACP methyl ester carboxylesterase